MDSEAYYDSLAREYQEQDEFWDNPYDVEVWRIEHQLLKRHLQTGRPLLDVGCGFYPHDGFGPNLPIVGVDVSFESLRIAIRNKPAGRTVQLIQSDAHQLPFRDGCFCQAVAGGELLNHVNYRTVLKELARVLVKDGILLVQFGAKWCLDSLWALLDSLLGHRIGYAVTRSEAAKFFSDPRGDAEVTWAITPHGEFRVNLLTVRNVRRALDQCGFTVVQTASADCLSGLIPLPWQQDPERVVAQRLARWLIGVDRLIGRVNPLRTFAGNVFFLCKQKAG